MHCPVKDSESSRPSTKIPLRLALQPDIRKRTARLSLALAGVSALVDLKQSVQAENRKREGCPLIKGYWARFKGDPIIEPYTTPLEGTLLLDRIGHPTMPGNLLIRRAKSL